MPPLRHRLARILKLFQQQRKIHEADVVRLQQESDTLDQLLKNLHQSLGHDDYRQRDFAGQLLTDYQQKSAPLAEKLQTAQTLLTKSFGTEKKFEKLVEKNQVDEDFQESKKELLGLEDFLRATSKTRNNQS